MNIWFHIQNVFKTHAVKWCLIYYGCALDTERYLAWIPAPVSNHFEFSLLAKIMADCLCCFHRKIWLKVVQIVTFMHGFGPLQESMVLCRGRGSVSCPLHQELLQTPAGRWGTLVGDAGGDGVSLHMCVCHCCPRQWKLSDVCLSDLTWEECGVLGCWSSWKIIRQAGLRDLFSTSPCCNFF